MVAKFCTVTDIRIPSPEGQRGPKCPELLALGFLEMLQPASGAEHWAFGAVLSGEGLEIAHGLHTCCSISVQYPCFWKSLPCMTESAEVRPGT